jgi:SAM-dependent methyltransferase
MFSKRLIEPELLDHCEPEAARASLADIAGINRRLGGHAAIRDLLRRVVRGEERFSLLDVGAASGDTAGIIGEEYPNATVVSLDRNAVNLERAPKPKLLADAFALPFRANSFDFVFCSLFLHHFTNKAAGELLRGFSVVARRAVLISDLERHWLPYLFMRVGQPIFRWHSVSVHDGLRSVRAGFRSDELLGLAREVGLHVERVKVHRPAFRLTVVGAKTEAGATVLP